MTQDQAQTSLSIAVSGSTGMVGSAFVAMAKQDGHQIHPMLREGSSAPRTIYWPQHSHAIDPQAFAEVDAVVHLAGESIVGRWTDAKKKAIHESRVPRTRALCEALAQSPNKPKVLICASAIGYYGEGGEAWLDESAPKGEGFLADVAAQWEQATAPATEAGIRVVLLRLGIILSPKGGALAKMLPIFKLALGGKIGNGEQYWSWVSLPDVVGIIRFALMQEDLHGPINVVAPAPVTNVEFTRAVGSAVARPTLFPVPAFAARLAFGQLADESFMASVRVKPQKLLDAGYTFQHPELSQALQQLLHGDTTAHA